VEVQMELYFGHMKSLNSVFPSFTEKMDVVEDRGGGQYLYACTINCRDSGRYGFTVRVKPRGDDQMKFIPEFITWA